MEAIEASRVVGQYVGHTASASGCSRSAGSGMMMLMLSIAQATAVKVRGEIGNQAISLTPPSPMNSTRKWRFLPLAVFSPPVCHTYGCYTV